MVIVSTKTGIVDPKAAENSWLQLFEAGRNCCFSLKGLANLVILHLDGPWVVTAPSLVLLFENLLKLDEKESKVQHANITKQTIPFHLEVKIIDFISK